MLQALSAYFLRLGLLRLDFLEKRSKLTVVPSMKLGRNSFATHIAAHLASRAKFWTFTSRASWRALFWDRDLYAGRILSSGLGRGGFLRCKMNDVGINAEAQ